VRIDFSWCVGSIPAPFVLTAPRSRLRWSRVFVFGSF
jgi:hypothetical protein